MRIAFFLDHFPGSVGGTERQLLLLVQELARRDIECAVYTLRGFSALEQALPGVQCRDLQVRKIASWRALKVVRKALEDEKQRGTRVIQTFLNDVSYLVPPLARSLGLRTVVGRRDLGFWYTPFGVRVLRLVGRHVDAYVANSEAVAEVVRRAEAARAPIKIIPNAVAPPSSMDQPAARQALGLRPEEFVVACIANLKPLKRQETAIAALALLPDPGSIRLVLVGGDNRGKTTSSYRLELERQASSLGVSGSLLMTGHMSDPRLVWAAADVGLLLSDSEGLSNAVLEGLAAGVPMICTAVGGNPELIEDGVNGFLVPCRDERAVARALEILRRDPQRRTRMGDSAREGVADRTAVGKVADCYLQLYRDLGVG